MAASDYWDSQDLKAVAAGGLVNEDVMQKIFDISKIPLPLTDAIMSDSHDNAYCEWTQDELNAPDLTNKVVSGADAGTKTDGNGKRVGNHSATAVKYVYVTERAQNSNVVGRSNELAYGLMKRQQELMRDIEAQALDNNASVEDDNNTTAGEAAGLDNFIETNVTNGGTGAAIGGFNTSTKVVDAHTNSTSGVAGDESDLSDLIETAYENNATPTILMSTPAVIKRLAQRLFSSSRVATPTANVSGTAPANQTSQGFINVMVTDFGFTLDLIPNRLQQDYDSNTRATLFGIDPQLAAISYMHRPKAEQIAKLGLSHRWQVSADWTLKVYQEKGHFIYRDIIEASAWTA